MRRAALVAALLAVIGSCQHAGARDAVLIWTSPGDDGMIGQVDSLQFGMKTVTVAGTDTLGWMANAARFVKRNPKAPGLVDSLVVPNLQAGTTYYFVGVAFAAGEAGFDRSPFSNIAILNGVDVVRPATIGLTVVGR